MKHIRMIYNYMENEGIVATCLDDPCYSITLKSDFNLKVDIISVSYEKDNCIVKFVYEGKKYLGSIHIMDLMQHIYNLTSF